MAEAKNDFEAFSFWATSLGCPPEAIPSEEALKSVYTSPQRDLFCTMIKRVRPRQEVVALHRYVLLRKVENVGGGGQLMIMPASSRAFLPEKLQTYFKIKDLERERSKSEFRLEEYKKAYDALAATLKTKNIQVIKAKQECDVLQAKVDILQLKSESLNEDITKEEELKEHLHKYMPVKLTAKNSTHSAGDQAIEQALKDLDCFYMSNSNAHQTAKEELWSNLRKGFFNIPNFTLFNAIMRLKEHQLQYIMELVKKKLDDSTRKKLMSPFEKELMRLKIDLLAFVVNQNEVEQEHKQIEEIFFNRYTHFVNDLKTKVCEFNTNEEEEHVEEVISDYIVQYNLRTFLKSQNEFIQQEIDKCRVQIEQNAKALQNHEALIGTVKQTYNDINVAINNVQIDMLQLDQIKQKILYSQNLLKYKLYDLRAKFSTELVTSNVGGNKVKNFLSPVAGTAYSFESCDESLLCSTKLDWDTSTAILNTSISIMKRNLTVSDTTVVTEAQGFLSPHSLELSAFAEGPLEKFSCLGRDCAFYLAPNPVIIESRELSSTLQLTPGTLLTQNGALQEVRNRIAWADLIASQSYDLKLNLDITTVDIQTYKKRTKAQLDRLTELLDKIDTTGINTKHTLQKAYKIYNFILDNTLRHYIPSTKRFNNHTYAEFETEFIMYYRIATAKSSIK